MGINCTLLSIDCSSVRLGFILDFWRIKLALSKSIELILNLRTAKASNRAVRSSSPALSEFEPAIRAVVPALLGEVAVRASCLRDSAGLSPAVPVHDLEQRADQDLGQEQIRMKVLGSLLMALWWGSSSVTASRSGPPKKR